MSVLRSGGVKSTLASFVEVVIFFCLLTPIFMVVCYAGFHLVHGPWTRSTQSSKLTGMMDDAQRAAERQAKADLQRSNIDPSSELAESLRDLASQTSRPDHDPHQTGILLHRVAELGGRKIRADADELDTATQFADETAQAAAEAMLADLLDEALLINTVSTQVRAYAEDLRVLSEEIVTSHQQAITDATATITQSKADIAEFTEAYRQLPQTADLSELTALTRLQPLCIRPEARKLILYGKPTAAYFTAIALHAKLVATRKQLAEAEVLRVDLEPLAESYQDAVAALAAVKPKATELLERSATLYEVVRDLTAKTSELAKAAAAKAEYASDAMRANRQAAATAIAEARAELLALATETRRLGVESQVVVEAAYVSISEALGPRAATFSWNLRRAVVGTGRLTRRARLAMTHTGDLDRARVLAGQSFWGESLGQGVGDVRLSKVLTTRKPFFNITELFGTMPWWIWIIEGLLYMVFILGYWSPGEKALDRCELQGFALFALTVAIVLVAANLGALIEQLGLILRIAAGQA